MPDLAVSCDDLGTVEEVVSRFYAAFDNREGQTPDIATLRALFVEDATIMRASSTALDVWTLDQFAQPRIAMLTNGTLTDFHEWESAGETAGGSVIVSRRSVYEKAGTYQGQPYGGGGRKFIQLWKSDRGWRIAAILWEDTDL